MFGSSDSLSVAVKEWRAWSKRREVLLAIVRQTIEDEGGEIEGISVVGFLLRSPFPPINLRPVYLRASCRYPNDTGVWYICGTDGGQIHWVWCSDTRTKEPPIERTPPVKLDNAVIAFSPWLSMLLYTVFFLFVMGLVFYLCVYA